MPLISARAVILQTFPYSDTSKILRLLSEEHGVRSVVAKGAMRPKSRFGGVLEPFTEGRAELFLKEGRDLHTLNGFDLIRSRQSIGRNLAAFTGASLIAELVLRFGTEESHPELFYSVTRALDDIGEADGDHSWRALAAVWHIVALLGYEPELGACVTCGSLVEEDEATRFDVDAGGIACICCRPRGRMIGPAPRADIQAMVRGGAGMGTPGEWSLHRALLRAFLSSHLVSDRPLRSLELFVEELR
ncbi:MAG: DNA repair protein RecO [Gemmatimonadetes bacterium]|nr:DNA repair protein RecO [Gemmatimonadota bacterium]